MVPGDNPLATQGRVIHILSSISFTVNLWIVPRYKFPSTQCPRIKIFCIMTFHMTLYVAIGDGSFATHSTVIWILPSVNLFVKKKMICVVVCWCTYPNSISWLGIIPIFYVALPVTILTRLLVLQVSFKSWLQWPYSRDEHGPVLSNLSPHYDSASSA